MINKDEEMGMNFMAGCVLIMCSLFFLISYLIDPLLAVFVTIPLSIVGWIYIFLALNYAREQKGK